VRSLPRGTTPRPPPDRATYSHNHVEVVAVFKRRFDNRHAACAAHGFRIGPTGHTNFGEHPRGADCTLFETLPAIFMVRVRNHASMVSEALCGAIRIFLQRNNNFARKTKYIVAARDLSHAIAADQL
jgi:hypothetical protein